MDPRPLNGAVPRWRSVAATVAAVATLLCAPTARADVVSPAPNNCPSWTSPGTCHGGPHCRIKQCVDSSTCGSGEACQEHKVCVLKIDCSGHNPTPSWVSTAKGTCGAGGSCDQGGTCSTVKICVAKGTLDDSDGGPTPPRGCSCRLEDGAGQAPAWGLLVLALALLRRQASRSRVPHHQGANQGPDH